MTQVLKEHAKETPAYCPEKEELASTSAVLRHWPKSSSALPILNPLASPGLYQMFASEERLPTNGRQSGVVKSSCAGSMLRITFPFNFHRSDLSVTLLAVSQFITERS